MRDGCLVFHNMGNMRGHSLVNDCPLVWYLALSQSLVITNNTTVNLQELNNLISRIPAGVAVVDVLKLCHQVLLRRDIYTCNTY